MGSQLHRAISENIERSRPSSGARAALAAITLLGFASCGGDSRVRSSDAATSLKGGKRGGGSASCLVSPNPVDTGSEYLVTLSGAPRNTSLMLQIEDAAGAREIALAADENGAAAFATSSDLPGSASATFYRVRKSRRALLVSCAYEVRTPCVPQSCEDLALDCGVADDGCGEALDCGVCAPVCENGDCGDVCGDGVCSDSEDCVSCSLDCGACWASPCLQRQGTVVEISGTQYERFRHSSTEAGLIFDATTASWPGLDASGDFITWTVTIRNAGAGSCWSGGRIFGAWDEYDPSVSWEDPYHHTGGFTIDVDNFLLDGVRIHNNGDGIRPYGPNAHIRSAHVTDIHDDCIENDDMHALLVEDSLFDGCYVGISARTHSGSGDVDGSERVWEIRDSLFRLEPQPTVYRGDSPGHGPFFKWDSSGVAPRVSLHNTIFRADQEPNHGGLGIPSGMVFESCSGNVVVWLGDGPYPDSLPSCFTITTDQAVWDDAVADWYARHPENAY